MTSSFLPYSIPYEGINHKNYFELKVFKHEQMKRLPIPHPQTPITCLKEPPQRTQLSEIISQGVSESGKFDP